MKRILKIPILIPNATILFIFIIYFDTYHNDQTMKGKEKKELPYIHVSNITF